MITIVNYGMGNIRSLMNALEYLAIPHKVTGDAREIESAQKLILPGVGSFKKAMENIHERDLFEPIVDAVKAKHTPILGICLGMQLMTRSSEEDGFTEGFGFVEGAIIKFPDELQLKIPHIGFNEVTFTHPDSLLFSGIRSVSDFYFVHSYYLPSLAADHIAGTTVYGNSFVSAFEFDNIYGTQFHPEKSQSNGLQVLKNFGALKNS